MRDTHRERQRHRWREPDAELRDHDLSQKHMLNHWDTQASLVLNFYETYLSVGSSKLFFQKLYYLIQKNNF